MARFTGMDVMGRRTRRREGRGDLASNVTALSHTGNNHTSGDIVQRLHRGGKASLHRFRKSGDTVRLQAEQSSRRRKIGVT